MGNSSSLPPPDPIPAVARNDPAVTSVTFHYQQQGKLKRNELAALCGALHRNTHVHTLDLFGQEESVGPAGAKMLYGAIVANRSLTSLQLWCCALGDTGAVLLANGLRQHPELRVLNVGGTNGICSEAAAHALCKALSEGCPQLSELNLWGCRGLGQGASTAPLIALLQPDRCKLTSLDLSACRLNGPPLRALLRSLTELGSASALRVLRLRANEFDVEDAQALAQLLSSNDTLTEADASLTAAASQQGAAVLAEAVQRNRCLLLFQLDVDHRSVESKPSLADIDRCLERNRQAAAAAAATR